MIVIHWPQFAGALILLLLPVTLLHSPNTRYRLMDRRWLSALLRALLFPWHWVDLLRSVMGFKMLQASFSLPGFGLVSPTAMTLIAQGAIVLLTVLINLMAIKNRDFSHAPFALVIAVLFVLLPPLVAVGGLVIAFTIALGIQVASAFFFVLPIAAFALVALLYPDPLFLPTAILTAISWTSPLMALLLSRKLVLANSPHLESHR